MNWVHKTKWKPTNSSQKYIMVFHKFNAAIQSQTLMSYIEI
jgi:hypothetical protein